MAGFGDIATGAPWWVYLLFAYLLSIGIKSTRPRTLSVQRVVLIPLLFLAWSFYSLYRTLPLKLPSLMLVWVVFFALGAYLGVKEVTSWRISINRSKGEITIPGNYSTLAIILLIFILKFVWGYLYATQAQVSYAIHFTDTLTSALVTGVFVGRAGFLLKSYSSKP